MSGRLPKATFAASIVITTFVIWGVHYQQYRERETMYQGVVRDEARRAEKMKQRQAEFDESQRKRAVYEVGQRVIPKEPET